MTATERQLPSRFIDSSAESLESIGKAQGPGDDLSGVEESKSASLAGSLTEDGDTILHDIGPPKQRRDRMMGMSA